MNPIMEPVDDGKQGKGPISAKKWLKVLLNRRALVIITFNPKLDSLLNGGITLGHLTEIFGEKGSGKTSLCLQLCITIRLPRRIQGLESEAIFIDSEHAFGGRRLTHMAEACVQHCRKVRGFESKITAEFLLSGIHCLPCHNLAELEALVLDLDDYISRHSKVKLVVIDNLTFLFHTDVGAISSTAWMERNRFLYRLFQELTALINKYALAVVVTNNMTTRFRGEGEKSIVASLGPSWPYLPQIRLELQRAGSNQDRKAILHKSLQAIPRENSSAFRITSAGIR